MNRLRAWAGAFEALAYIMNADGKQWPIAFPGCGAQHRLYRLFNVARDSPGPLPYAFELQAPTEEVMSRSKQLIFRFQGPQPVIQS